MKITNATGTYAKRINPLIKLFWTYFDAHESNTREAVSRAAALVRYFKSKKIYFTVSAKEVVADTRSVDGACNIVLDIYIENKAVCCEDTITLLFPTIEEVLDYEKIAKGE